MLVIGRKQDERLIIDGGIEITILKVGRNYVRFGIKAPREFQIQTRMKGSESDTPAVGPGRVREVAVGSDGTVPAPPVTAADPAD